MFSANVAFVLDGDIIEFLGHALNQEWGSFAGEIEEGIEVEVAVTTMPMDS
jgi:hypothetical protein